MMHLVTEALRLALADTSPPSLGTLRVGTSVPTTTQALVVALQIDSLKARGIGRVSRTGDRLTQSVRVIEAGSTSGAFSADLRILKIAPCPCCAAPKPPEASSRPAMSRYATSQDRRP
jgi:hypothetical protein